MTHTETAPWFQTMSTEKQFCYWIQMTTSANIANNIRFQYIGHHFHRVQLTQAKKETFFPQHLLNEECTFTMTFVCETDCQ